MVQKMRNLHLPGFICPKQFPDMLQEIGVSKGERLLAATDIVMCIIYQIILCYDTYTHCIQHKLQRTKYVVTSKYEIDQNREIKTCEACRRDTQSAVLVSSRTRWT